MKAKCPEPSEMVPLSLIADDSSAPSAAASERFNGTQSAFLGGDVTIDGGGEMFSVLSRFRGSFAHDGTMRRSASLHRTLQTAFCSSKEENLLDCEEPRRYGRRASRLLCSVPMSSRLKWFLANERVQPRESRFEDFFL